MGLVRCERRERAAAHARRADRQPRAASRVNVRLALALAHGYKRAARGGAGSTAVRSQRRGRYAVDSDLGRRRGHTGLLVYEARGRHSAGRTGRPLPVTTTGAVAITNPAAAAAARTTSATATTTTSTTTTVTPIISTKHVENARLVDRQSAGRHGSRTGRGGERRDRDRAPRDRSRRPRDRDDSPRR